ncbi:hypothetical protein HYPSUDRAFT_67515 [Hypholoma sublateritium FD-334 SS-4]|uniref:Uncharacterized protein n=1 Tax=Hypholoma sublateritium (strain FD-334 SS-4) TaxID=945553 RepID=A0A0D2PPJ8_HYPSF|nr:hypothetical protein HYPSUDRAFT_67515 [Hypholoma sublateritium FD-334 SS-4]
MHTSPPGAERAMSSDPGGVGYGIGMAFVISFTMNHYIRLGGLLRGADYGSARTGDQQIVVGCHGAPAPHLLLPAGTRQHC